MDRTGVVLLPEFAGAAEAILVNPYDPEGMALRIRDALTLPAPERAAAMERLQGSLDTIYDWLNDVFTAWGSVAQGSPSVPASPPPGPLDEEDELFAEVDAGEPEPRGSWLLARAVTVRERPPTRHGPAPAP